MINPELNAFLDVWDAGWARLAEGATPADRRAHFEVVAQEMRLATPKDVDCDDTHVIDSVAGQVRVRVFRHTSGGAQPCLIYMHGGAYIQGSPETHWDITSRIAAWSRMTVISVDYAKSPEHRFPDAFDQCVAVAHWVRANAEKLGVDPTRLSVGGDSAGGNLSAAVALALRTSEVDLIAQLLIYPCCDFDMTRPSYIENADGPLLQVKGMSKVNAMYCPQTERLTTDWRVAPLVAESHEGLPATYIAVAQCDPLRDSGLAYAEALTAAAVPVTVDAGEGLIHGYLRAMEYCEASHRSLQAMAKWLDGQNQRHS